MKRTPLQRRTPLKPGGPIRSGTSRPRRSEPVRRAPAPPRDAFRIAVESAAGGRCQARVSPACRRDGSEAHHRWRKGQGGPDTTENGRWLCAPCHDLIHFGVVDWARRHLWLISPGHPLDPPVDCPLSCDEDHTPGVAGTHDQHFVKGPVAVVAEYRETGRLHPDLLEHP